jgi:hypothetical protein
MKVDLLNGVVLELNYDKDLKAFRGYWKEENINVGIWKLQTLFDIYTKKINTMELVV